MKSYSAARPPGRVSEQLHPPAIPTDPTDRGTENFGCHLCGAVFIRNATRDYLRRVGYVYCKHCDVWSQSQSPGDARNADEAAIP